MDALGLQFLPSPPQESSHQSALTPRKCGEIVLAAKAAETCTSQALEAGGSGAGAGGAGAGCARKVPLMHPALQRPVSALLFRKQ